ncbi:MAG: hypothetical protein GW902_09415 [Alphaproteobacteria bacterium]|nr:hypothetical protein [Alphaproteobacteria bacterium]
MSRRGVSGLRLVLILALSLIAPMAPAAMADPGAHPGHALSAPMSHDAQPDAEDADGGWLAHLACAVVCAGAPDPAVAQPDAPRLAPARRVWPRVAIPPGMALSPLRRPPKPPTA